MDSLTSRLLIAMDLTL